MFVSTADFLVFPAFLVAGILLRIVLRFLYGARGPASDDSVWAVLNGIAWALMFVGVAPLLFLLVRSWLGMVFLLLPVVALVEYFITRRETQRRTNAALLALLAESPEGYGAAEVFAESQGRGYFGSDTQSLLTMVAHGMSLRLALHSFPKALPRDAAAYAAVGDLTHSTPTAMRELAKAKQSPLVGLNRNLFDRIIYLVIVVAVFVPILVFIMVKIIPEFRKIFDEFSMDLPRITELIVSMSEFLVRFWAFPLLAGALFLMVLILLGAAAIFGDLPILQGLLDRITASRHIATLYRLLALTFQHHAPLSPVLESLTRTLPAQFMRSRVSVVQGDVAAGTPWIESLRRRGLLTHDEVRLLQAGEAAGNVDWTLRTLADRRERRWTYRLTAITQFVFPLLVLAIGFVVGLVVIGLFVPLVTLIDGLAF